MTGSDYVLEAEGLTKQFRGFYAVSGVNIKVRRGSIHALIGPNGAGKTTVFNLLTKFLEPTSGRILYNGEDITRTGSAAIARKGMVRSFQISAVFPQLTALENVRVALQQPTGLTHKFWKDEKVLDSMNEQAMELLEAVGLQDFVRVPAGELPYGRKRSLEIATTLALDPEFMLLDEPTAGMAHEDVSRVSALIKRVSKDRTVLLVEHNLGVVADLSDTITVLQRGEILVEGDYDTLANNPEVREAYMGTGYA